MTILDELKIFLRSIRDWIISFSVASCFFFVFGLKKVVVFGANLLVPWPSDRSFSIIIFNKMRENLLPPGVDLITTNPMSAFTSQVLVSILLGFLLTTPLFLYKVIAYLHPALLPQEKKAVLLSLAPLVILFFAGSAFSYFFLIPATFKLLYPYAISIGAIPFFAIDEFIYYVCGLMVAAGMMFLLPLFMVLLSFMGIIDSHFWRKHWPTACLFFLIASAIITPDGTGVTMVMLFLPLLALYLMGCVAIEKFNKQ